MGRFPILAAFLVLVAAVGPVTALAGPTDTGQADSASSHLSPGQEVADPSDPQTDTIGWENGAWYNESINVDQSDGLNDTEIERFVARSMARVEVLRQKEFKNTVPVEIISREQYRERLSNRSSNETFTRWNDQIWEALFIVGENTGSDDALSSTRGSSVAGFYSPRDDEIKIITDTPDSPTISNVTLIHELVHALQDQYFNLSRERYRGQTQDEQLATDGVVEGEANYIQEQYVQRCNSGEWDCVSTPSTGGSGSPGDINLGVLLTLLNPYSDGPVYVDRIVSNGGWEAFEKRFANPPNTTEQIIHLTAEEPTPIHYNDTARNGWQLFPNQGVNGADSVGEASIYAMFWYQARQYDANTIDPQSLIETDEKYDTYNYSSPASSGWGNDKVFPYRKVTDNGTKYGYVWVTEWDTPRDAAQFKTVYLEMLEAHDVRETEDGYLVVPDGPFEDAFLVVRNGTRVTIVNGPTVEDVRDIRPTLEPNNDPEQTSPPPTTAASNTTTDGTATANDGSTTPGPTETTAAGFGFLVAALAVALAALLARLR